MKKLNLCFLLNVIFIYVFFTSFSFAQEVFTVSNKIIHMADGTGLSTDVYLPKSESPFPTILIRSPYNKNSSKGEGEKFTKMGYVVVIQDTRGKFESEGKFYPFKHDRKDGLETIKWIKAQDWSNGKIAGWGGSYVGYTQWAIADQLDAFVPVVTSANMYDLIYPGGIFSLATAFNWGLAVDSKTINNIKPEKIIAAYSILPLSIADDSTFAQNDFVDDWTRHQFYDPYWGAQDHRSAITTPFYSIAGWYDIFLEAQIKDFVDQGERRHPKSRLVIGPYAHGQITIETDYGEHANLYRNKEKIYSFLESILKDNPTQDNSKPFSLFVMHKNEWVESDTWPPANTKTTPLYFNTGGSFSDSVPPVNKKAKYSYDPLNPFISLGGTFLGVGVGPAFQNPNVERKDQIIFDSVPMENPLTLLGPVSATIYVSSDAPSTDFFVSLQEVSDDGKIINIQEGGKTVYSDAASLPRPQKVDISLWATGYQIKAGHKIRVMINSCLFPRYNRNLNSGEPIFSAQNPQVANQTFYFGNKYPSHILLPIFTE